MQTGLYGERLGRSFRLANPPTLISRTRGGSNLAVTELHCDSAGFGLTLPLPADDAYLVMLHTQPVRQHELWLDGHLMNSRPTRADDICFCDMRRSPVAFMDDPFRLLAFYLPMAALAEVGDELGRSLNTGLLYDAHASTNDPVVANLGQSLMPYLSAAAGVNQLYVDHVLLALRSHLAVRYGGLKVASSVHRGGLAPWQRRRAQDLLYENLADGISLEKLAQACSLSPSAFLRAFRKSTGLPPHQWLLVQRVGRAVELLRQGGQPLSEIALCAGFSDQSHFTRVFSQHMGVSPGAWRRAEAVAAR